MRKLVVFGDSFVEGHNVVKIMDDGPNIVELIEKNMCYHLQRELGIEVINRGKSAACNQTIANEVFRYIASEDVSDTAFLIVWSDIRRRYNIHFSYIESEDLMKWDNRDFLVGGSVLRHRKENKNLPEFTNPASWRLWYEQAVHSVRSICNDHDIPFLMTNSIDNTPHMDKVVYQRSVVKFIVQHGDMQSNYIEHGRNNNTLLDIITDNWLSDEDERPYIIKMNNIEKNVDKYKEHANFCMHPNAKGSELIAKTLKPYIESICEN